MEKLRWFMIQYKIRTANKSDMKELIQLCKDHAEYEKSEYTIESKGEKLGELIFNDNPKIQCLVAEMNSRLIGYATYMKQYSTWDASFYMYLDCLYLCSEERNTGIGRKIMLRIFEEAKEKNCICVQWQTPGFNKDAIGFYNHLGAVSKDKKRFFYNL